MKTEIIVSAKTIDAAVAEGAAKLGVDAKDVSYEVITEPKKGFFGIGEVKAEVKVIFEKSPEKMAVEFLETLIADMELKAQITVTNGKGNEKFISINGDDVGVLIGHHGDTLDALQYLVNLVANKKEDENEDRNYTKISLDIENYRAQRQETLETLARRMSEKVLKYKKSITLEPMSPYERRIIHSAVQNIEGVSTNSIGNDNNRRVVIFLEK